MLLRITGVARGGAYPKLPQRLPLVRSVSPSRESECIEDLMLRISIAAALIFLSSFAFAQRMEEVKDLEFGAECLAPIKPLAPRLGACMIADSKARIWCPNGKVFNRDGAPPQISIVRSICGLNQVL